MAAHYQEDEINIRDLVIEEPSKEDPLFDPRKEISPEIRQKIREKVRLSQMGFNFTTFLSSCQYAKILFPEDINQDLITTDNLPRIESFINELWERVGHAKYLMCAASLRIASPSLAQKFQVDWDKYLQNFEREKRFFVLKSPFAGPWFFDLITAGTIIFPERIKTIRIPPDLKQRMLSEFELRKGDLELGYGRFLNLAYQFRIIFPNEDVESFADKETQKALINSFRTINPDKNFEHYLSTAANLTVLLAKEVKVTDQGLELVMPEPEAALSKPTDLPQRRRF